MTLTLTIYWKGCTLKLNMSILRGVFDIDPHRLPKGLHAEIEKCKLDEVFLTLTLTVYRKGCTLKLKLNDMTMILKRPNHEVS